MASTVGTIMALLVFLTFLSLITNQYVPVWMKDSESGHMGEALGEIGTFKSAIDLQILAARTAAIAGQHYIPTTTYASVKMGVDGVPIFSTSTLGQIVLDQSQAPWTIWFRYSISGNNTTVPEATCACGGNVVLTVFNRYYPQQSIAYENGAMIRAQLDGQVVKAQPSFDLFVTNTSVQVDFTLVQIFGSGEIAGVTAEGIQAQVIGVDYEEYTKIQTDVYANETTQYGPAWYNFLNDTLSAAYGFKASKAPYNKQSGWTYTAHYDVGGKPTQLTADNPTYTVQSLWNTANNWYAVTLRFKKGTSFGVTPLPITAFRLQHAYVNVAVGERGNELGI